MQAGVWYGDNHKLVYISFMQYCMKINNDKYGGDVNIRGYIRQI